jgi:hypothetical protein
LTLQLNDAASDVPWLEGTRWIDAALDQRLPWRHHVVTSFRRRSSGTTLWPSTEAFRVDYVIPLGVPLGAAGDGGRITLRLRDESTGRGVPQVLVQVAGRSLLTDRSGVADFVELPPGQHHLSVSAHAVGPDHTVVPAMPLLLSLARGQHRQVDATIAHVARLDGTIGLLDAPLAGPAEPATPADGLPLSGALIEISNETQRRLTVSDARGRFEFADLAPGTWRVTVVQADIPPFYALQTSSVTVDLTKARTSVVSFWVVPKPTVPADVEE